jgi:hypothetical protein
MTFFLIGESRHLKICTTVTEKSLAHLTLYNRPKKKKRKKYLSQLQVWQQRPAWRRRPASQQRGVSGGSSAAGSAAAARRWGRPANWVTNQPTNQLTD